MDITMILRAYLRFVAVAFIFVIVLPFLTNKEKCSKVLSDWSRTSAFIKDISIRFILFHFLPLVLIFGFLSSFFPLSASDSRQTPRIGL